MFDPALMVRLEYMHRFSVVGNLVFLQAADQDLQLIGKMVGTEHDALDTRTEDRMASHVNQALQTVLCEDEAAMGKSLLTELLCGYVGQCLAGEVEVR
jgi:hypothetical protein